VITISEVQRLAWANKLAKGFGTTDVPREFALAHGELAEAFEAWRKNPEELPAELADVVIYAACIAQMAGVDLGQAVVDKLAVNAARTYQRNPGGHLVKTGRPTPQDPNPEDPNG
jgi:NTP pyrophosphatase (non-canonical NTP hydrolase)